MHAAGAPRLRRSVVGGSMLAVGYSARPAGRWIREDWIGTRSTPANSRELPVPRPWCMMGPRSVCAAPQPTPAAVTAHASCPPRAGSRCGNRPYRQRGHSSGFVRWVVLAMPSFRWVDLCMNSGARISFVLSACMLASGCTDRTSPVPPRMSRAYSVWHRYEDGALAFAAVDRRLGSGGFTAGPATTNGTELLSRYTWASTSGIECTLRYEANGLQYDLRLLLQCREVDDALDAAWSRARSSAVQSWTEVIDAMPISEKR